MRQTAVAYLVCSTALLLAAIVSLALGAEWIAPRDALQVLLARLGIGQAGPELAQADTILFVMRLPRLVLMTLVGAALGASGAAYQGLLRNPLADPYLIGAAPGAAFGGTLAIVFLGPSTLLGYLTVPVCAFVGALATVAVVYRVARVGTTTPTTLLVLVGVAIGAFASAATSFVMLLRDEQIQRVVYFLWGGFGLRDWTPVVASLPYIALAIGVLCVYAHPLNALQFGDEQAEQLGVPVERVKLVFVAAATLATGAAVAFTGIIGFVGLIVPHLLRLLWGSDYRRLVPLSALSGATLLLAADVLQRATPVLDRTPVGVVTALVGAPFFLVILRRHSGREW